MEGYISKYPTIEINLYHDDIKAVEYILLNNQIQFEITDMSLYGKGSKKKSNRNLPIYKIESDLMPIQIKVFETNDFKIGSKNLLKARGMDIKALESFEPNLFLEDTQQPV